MTADSCDRTSGDMTSGLATPRPPTDPLARITHLWNRQMAVMYSDRPPLTGHWRQVDPARLPVEDQAPESFKRLGREIDLSVREAYDGTGGRAGLSVSAIYNATPLSRNEIKRALEATHPSPSGDAARAKELASQTRMHGLAQQTAGQMVTALSAGETATAERLRSKYIAFFGEWKKAQVREWADDPDAQAIMLALDTLVRECLSAQSIAQQIENRRRFPPDSKWRRRNW